MQHFTTAKDRFREVRKKLLMANLYGYVIGTLLVAVGHIILREEPSDSLISTLIIMIPVSGVSLYYNLKRQKRTYESFRLTITEDAVIREQADTPTITIPRNRINEIFRTGSGIICIVGESKLNAIGVPLQIENREELERKLSEIRPIVTKSPWTSTVILQLIGIAVVIAGCPIGLLTDDRPTITVSGFGLCAFLVVGFILIHRSKHFDRRMKRMSYLTIIPLLGVLSYVIMQWV